MTKGTALTVVGFALVAAVSPVLGQQPTLVVENGRVITGEGTVLQQASVVVAGDSILSVTREPVEAPQARRIDASGKTVLPGLIDAHVHLTIPPQAKDSTALVNYLDDGVPEVLQGFLEHGVTIVRSTGDYWPWIRQVREGVAQGNLSGPRIVTAGPILTAKGAHPATSVCGKSPDPFCRSHLTRELTGPEDGRKAVRRLAQQGVDFIKLVSDSTIVPVQIEDTVVAAVVDQAHREGLKAVGHVAEPHLMESYAEMGMDGFVHPPFATGSGFQPRTFADVLIEQDTPITTTQSAGLLYSGVPVDSMLRRRSEYYSKKGTRGMRAILERAGVTVAVGTDWCACLPKITTAPDTSAHPAIRPGVVTVTEMQLLHWEGMSRQAVIQAATANAARALEMGEKVGTLEAGKLADLIVVDGNPLEDLSALEEVEVVVKGGEVVADNR